MEQGRNTEFNSSNRDDAGGKRMKPIEMFEAITMLIGALLLIAFLFVTFGYLIVQIWRDMRMTLGPRSPCMSITSIDVMGPLNVTYAKSPSKNSPTSTLTGSWNVSFAYENQEHVKITYFDGVNVSIYYDHVFLGNNFIRFHSLYQSKNQQWVNMSTRIDARSVHLNDLLAYTLAQDINDNTTGYGVEMQTRALIKSDWWFNGERSLYHSVSNTSYDIQSCPFYHHYY